MSVPTSKSGTAHGLREAAEALHQAQTAVGDHDGRGTHEALIALARASYEALSGFERESLPPEDAAHALHDRLMLWRQEVDEARVQLALAEMEARDASVEIVQRVERIIGPESSRVTGAVREIAAVLSDLRRGLTDRAS